MSTLTITLVNNTTSSNVYAHITGIPLDGNNGPVCFIRADGTPFYPTNPPSDHTPVTENIAIPLAAPGSSSPKQVTIPRLGSGRISFSINTPLKFFLNPGPAIVQQSVTDQADENINTQWDFCEFTFDGGLFSNITYVDFVSLPIALSLTNTSGAKKEVLGLPRDGLIGVYSRLQLQTQLDKAPWNELAYFAANNGPFLRVLSPSNSIAIDGQKFAGYYEEYIGQCWDNYKSNILLVDTQSAAGVLNGIGDGDKITFSGGGGSFSKPSTADVFSCNTGPFGGLGNTTAGNVAARLCASLNRSTLLTNSQQPDLEDVATYYPTTAGAGGSIVPTNHYSRIVHDVNIDHRGYAFPFDDVVPNAGADQAGVVFDSRPLDFVVTVGGPSAGATNVMAKL